MKYRQSKYKKEPVDQKYIKNQTTVLSKPIVDSQNFSDRRKFAKDFLDFVISSGVIGTIIINLVTDAKKGVVLLFGVKMSYITIFAVLCGIRLYILQREYIYENFKKIIRDILLTILIAGGFTIYILKTPDEEVSKIMSESTAETLLTFTSAVSIVFIIFLMYLLINKIFINFKKKE